jgi:hypothetical protein
VNARIVGYGTLGALVMGSWAAFGQKPSAPPQSERVVLVPTMEARSTPAALPQIEARRPLEMALRDPFAVMPPPPGIVVPPPPVPTVHAAPLAPVAPAPSAPPLNLRYTGRMLGPDGSLSIFALLDNEPVLLTVGKQLSNGFRVEKISEQAVELLYPPLNTSGTLALPPLPAFEVR